MKYTFAELKGVKDLDLGASQWLTIEQKRIDAFAEATDDHQWIHTDPERAAKTPFGSTIAHGYLLLSMVPKLFNDMFLISDAAMLVNFGLDKVRFMKPVPSGSQIRMKAKIESATVRKGNLLLRIRGFLMLRPTDDDGEGRRAVVIDALFMAIPQSEAQDPEPES